MPLFWLQPKTPLCYNLSQRIYFERAIAMKTKKTVLFVCLFSILTITFLAGCDQNSKGARLVGAENIKLKKTIAKRDKLIEKQKQQLAQCEEKQKKFQKKSIQALSGMTEMLLGKPDQKNKN